MQICPIFAGPTTYSYSLTYTIVTSNKEEVMLT